MINDDDLLNTSKQPPNQVYHLRAASSADFTSHTPRHAACKYTLWRHLYESTHSHVNYPCRTVTDLDDHTTHISSSSFNTSGTPGDRSPEESLDHGNRLTSTRLITVSRV